MSGQKRQIWRLPFLMECLMRLNTSRTSCWQLVTRWLTIIMVVMDPAISGDRMIIPRILFPSMRPPPQGCLTPSTASKKVGRPHCQKYAVKHGERNKLPKGQVLWEKHTRSPREICMAKPIPPQRLRGTHAWLRLGKRYRLEAWVESHVVTSTNLGKSRSSIQAPDSANRGKTIPCVTPLIDTRWHDKIYKHELTKKGNMWIAKIQLHFCCHT